MQTPTMRPSPATQNTAIKKLKTPVSDYDSGLSPKLVSKAPKERSPKPEVTKGHRAVTAERRRGKGSEMESQIAHLEEELKKAKNQLNSSESSKVRYQLEVEEAKRKLAAMCAKLDETEKQLDELSENEDARVQELCKISHDRDKAWQSELEALQKQHTMDSAALASAMNEIHRLKIQLERVSHSEASRAKQVEAAHAEIHSLRMELEETLVLIDESRRAQLDNSRESEENGEESEINMLRNEVTELRFALKEEYIQSTLEMRNAYDLMEQSKSESLLRESELESKLNESMAEIEELRKETEYAQSQSKLEEQLESILEQNEILKSEIVKSEMERHKANEIAISLVEESHLKLRSVTEEAERSFRKVQFITKELSAAQASKTEMETELRRVKVQCDQWRKAAEMAAAMISGCNNGEMIIPLNDHSLGRRLSCQYSEDTDDDSPKKRNNNMLKKIRVLLKKGQK